MSMPGNGLENWVFAIDHVFTFWHSNGSGLHLVPPLPESPTCRDGYVRFIDPNATGGGWIECGSASDDPAALNEPDCRDTFVGDWTDVTQLCYDIRVFQTEFSLNACMEDLSLLCEECPSGNCLPAEHGRDPYRIQLRGGAGVIADWQGARPPGVHPWTTIAVLIPPLGATATDLADAGWTVQGNWDDLLLQVTDVRIELEHFNNRMSVHERIGVDNIELFQRGLSKRIIAGPDVDNDGEVDRVVEAGTSQPVEYTYEIVYNNPGGLLAEIRDLVPNKWDVVSAVPANAVDGVTINAFGNGNGPTQIEWLPEQVAAGCTIGGDARLAVTIRTREANPPPNYHPRQCGTLRVNQGAEAFEQGGAGPPIFSSNRLCLAALEDVNGFGIVRDGSGDEDGNGVSDYEEACELAQDPCQ
jgi:hypothetical protein